MKQSRSVNQLHNYHRIAKGKQTALRTLPKCKVTQKTGYCLALSRCFELKDVLVECDKTKPEKGCVDVQLAGLSARQDVY